MRIALLRHGQTEWSLSGRHTSVTDIDLTEHGRDEARSARDVISGVGLHPALVVASPRLRAQRTAELAGLVVDEIWDDLAEWAYGDYEGLTSVEIHQQRPGWSIFTDGAPAGESPDQVGTRADAVLARAVDRASEGDVVLVCHGHFSRVLAARWAQLPVTAGAVLAMDPAAVTVLGRDRGRPIIEHSNVIPFLPTWSAP